MARKKGRRRSRNINVHLGGIAIGAATARQLGFFDAGQNLMDGVPLVEAVAPITNNSVADIMAASVPPIVYGFMKKMTGSPTLFSLGRVKIKI